MPENRLKNNRTWEERLVCPVCHEPIRATHVVAFQKDYAVHLECPKDSGRPSN
jgi:hypothetical protein